MPGRRSSTVVAPGALARIYGSFNHFAACVPRGVLRAALALARLDLRDVLAQRLVPLLPVRLRVQQHAVWRAHPSTVPQYQNDDDDDDDDDETHLIHRIDRAARGQLDVGVGEHEVAYHRVESEDLHAGAKGEREEA